MPRRFQFQLAIEGGGARLADLLTALTVIQEYEQKKKIQITRLAGTSAGALAACVYACGGDSCQRALDYLEERAPHASKRILPKINTWNWISKILPRLLLGRSLCNENLIKSEIDSLFQKVLRTNSQNIIINDLMKTSPNLERLNIITTDMRSYRARSIYGENENLTEALFNSCAIPVVFKGAKSLVQPFVDGGLCENLPSDFLDVGQAEVVQPILAITFENKAPKYKQINTIKFIRELFSVAINNSVYRARSALPPQSILSLSTNTDVFDFANAFDATSRQGDFDSIKLRTEAWLERNIRLENSKSSNKIFSFVPGNKAAEEIMIGLRKWYLKTHSNVKRNVLRDVTIITAHSLSETSDHPVDRLDDIEKEFEFSPVEEPLQALHFSLGFDEQDESILFDYERYISVNKSDGSKIPFEVFPTMGLKKEAYGSNLRHWGYLLLFEQPLRPMNSEDCDNSSYVVRYRTQYPDVFRELRQKGRDYFDRLISYEGVCQEAIVVLHYPEAFEVYGSAKARESENAVWKSIDSTDGERSEQWSRRAPISYRTLAWQANRLATGGRLSVELRKLWSDI